MTDERIERLEARLAHLEDESAIGRLIASYGPLVDAGAADAAAELWAVDGTYDVEDWLMRGRDDVRDMVTSDAHQGLIGRGCSHFLGPAVVTVDGDGAVAVCESILLMRRGDGYTVLRAGVNHFVLGRIEGRWQIRSRTTRTLNGDALPRELLAAGVAGRVR
jgi:SnoaL-like domain